MLSSVRVMHVGTYLLRTHSNNNNLVHIKLVLTLSDWLGRRAEQISKHSVADEDRRECDDELNDVWDNYFIPSGAYEHHHPYLPTVLRVSFASALVRSLLLLPNGKLQNFCRIGKICTWMRK